jgi:protoporphyrinogen/coproporphyrinogen III oxidase
VGAGISGLTCAYALKKSGQNVLLLEASARPGGVIQSVEENGYLFEQGPQSFSSTAELAELCDDLQLTPGVVAAPHGAPRYVLIDGKLVQVPMSPALLVSGLLSWNTKFLFLRDALGKTSPPTEEESIATFVRRKFSAELLERLVGPFVSGVYAGDPEQLSLRAAFPKLYEAEKAAGSVVRGAVKLGKAEGQKTVKRPRPRPRLLSFRTGNEALVRALAANLGASLRCNVTVAELNRATGSFQLRIRSAEGEQELSCARMVLATPTTTAAELLSNVAPSACGGLQKISYAPVAVVSLGYRTEQIRHSMKGFGFLVPRSAGIRTLGTVWNSSLFPGRAPQGQVLLTSFIGGATDRTATSLSPEELAATIHREISPLLRISGEPVTLRVTRYARAIPQYNLGHLDRLKSIQDAITAVPGLWMVGNYWKGPAIGACVEHALSVAEAVRIG